MNSILSVVAGAKGDESISTKLANAVVAKLTERHPDCAVTIRDLSRQKFPHLEEAYIDAFFAPDGVDNEAHREATRHSDEVIREVNEADALVIGFPMYNFGVPSALKAWVDHLVRVKKTFAYNEQGYPVGLLKSKPVYLAIASGSVYTDGPYKAYDFTEPYMRAILGFIGLTDIHTFRAEGTAIPGLGEAALQRGIDSIAVA